MYARFACDGPLDVCAHACSMYGNRACGHMCVPRMAIPCVAHDKLRETCMFHAMRKHGPCKHIMRLFKVVSCCYVLVYVCKNEVMIE